MDDEFAPDRWSEQALGLSWRCLFWWALLLEAKLFPLTVQVSWVAEEMIFSSLWKPFYTRSQRTAFRFENEAHDREKVWPKFVVFAIPFGKQTSWQAKQLARTAKCSAKFLRLVSSLAFVAVIGKHSSILLIVIGKLSILAMAHKNSSRATKLERIWIFRQDVCKIERDGRVKQTTTYCPSLGP